MDNPLSVGQLLGAARPHYVRWVQAGIAFLAGGYLVAGAVSVLTTDRPVFNSAAEFLASALAVVGLMLLRAGRPVDASRLAMAAVWTELHWGFFLSGSLRSSGLPVLPAVVVATGLLLGGRATVIAGWVSCVSAPLVASLGRRFYQQQGWFAPNELHVIVVLVMTLLAISYLTRLALGSFGLLLRDVQVKERRLDDLVRSVPDGVVALDEQGLIDTANPAADALLSAAPGQLRGRPLRSLLEHVLAPVDHADAAEIATGSGLMRTLTIRRPDGQTMDIEATGHRTVRGDGSAGVLVVLRDVTEQRRADARQSQLRTQLAQAQRMEAIGQFAGGVAHDFNNLLHAIGGNLELARLHVPDGHQAARYLGEIQKASGRAADLIRQLLAYTRRQPSMPLTVSLNDITSGVESILRRLLPADINFTVTLGADLPLTRVDPSLFEQAIVNLVVNARDAMPTGGHLRVSTRGVLLEDAAAMSHAVAPPGEYVELLVADSGSGISAAARAHIFEPFFTTKRDGKGTGLGLAMVYGIVAQANGFIRVDSQEGFGTEFRILLPATSEQDPGAAAEAPAPADTADRRGHERILVVEDEPQVRALTARALRTAGYEVIEAADGVEALEFVTGSAAPIDLLVTDVVMPRMGGRELADRLATVRPGLRVLFTSGYAEDAIAHRGVLDKGVALLSKPFTPRELTTRVRGMLDDAAPEAAAGA